MFVSDNFNPAEDNPNEEGKCSVIVGLMQEYRRVGRSSGMENLYLAFNVFKVNVVQRNLLLFSTFLSTP